MHQRAACYTRPIRGSSAGQSFTCTASSHTYPPWGWQKICLLTCARAVNHELNPPSMPWPSTPVIAAPLASSSLPCLAIGCSPLVCPSQASHIHCARHPWIPLQTGSLACERRPDCLGRALNGVGLGDRLSAGQTRWPSGQLGLASAIWHGQLAATQQQTFQAPTASPMWPPLAGALKAPLTRCWRATGAWAGVWARLWARARAWALPCSPVRARKGLLGGWAALRLRCACPAAAAAGHVRMPLMRMPLLRIRQLARACCMLSGRKGGGFGLRRPNCELHAVRDSKRALPCPPAAVPMGTHCVVHTEISCTYTVSSTRSSGYGNPSLQGEWVGGWVGRYAQFCTGRVA